MYFSTQISELTPAMLEEEVYPDYNDAKVRYFVFNDNEIYKKIETVSSLAYCSLNMTRKKSANTSIL